MAAVAEIRTLAVNTPDADFLADRLKPLFRDGEVKAILKDVRDRLIPNLSEEIETWRWNFDSNDDDPEGYFDRFVEAIRAYSDELADDPTVVSLVDKAVREVRDVVTDLQTDRASFEPDYDDSYTPSGVGDVNTVNRSIFDDVDR